MFHAYLDLRTQTLSTALATGLLPSSVICMHVKRSTFDEADALQTHQNIHFNM